MVERMASVPRNLPAGESCGTCAHFQRCYPCANQDTDKRWHPSRLTICTADPGMLFCCLETPADVAEAAWKDAHERHKSERVRLVRNEAAVLRRKTVAGARRSCEYCRWHFAGGDLLHVHHVVEVSKGGDNSPANLIVLCPNHHAIAHHLRGRPDLKIRTRDDLLEAVRRHRQKERKGELYLPGDDGAEERAVAQGTK